MCVLFCVRYEDSLNALRGCKERKRKAEEKKQQDEEEYRKRQEEAEKMKNEPRIEEVTEEEADKIKASKAKNAEGEEDRTQSHGNAGLNLDRLSFKSLLLGGRPLFPPGRFPNAP